MASILKKHSAWLKAPTLKAVFDALQSAGGEVRVNGGAVRNSLMGRKVGDIDLSTTLVPDETMAALKKAGIRAIGTGIDHGTVTAVAEKTPYEITTLREDIKTDGRHAVVKFGTSWELDAKRRDLTINGLYCNLAGEIFDPLDGLGDIKSGTVRFIGDAGERIEEDYLRILRFFRFFAWYGSGRPDGDGLKASAKHKAGLGQISAERIWKEFRTLLSAPDPGRALLWMRTSGVLNVIMPESEKWGIDLMPHLITAEGKWRWKADPMLRLAAMMRPDGEVATGLARRLKFSGEETSRLTGWAMAELPPSDMDENALAQMAYHCDRQGLVDRLKLELALLTSKPEAGPGEVNQRVGQVKFVSKWKRPKFPLQGQDLLDMGVPPGPEVGTKLRQLEKAWVDSGFTARRNQLLAMVQT